jgi:hypothetical protein
VSLIRELRITCLYTAVLSMPLAFVSYHLANAHGGPGGYLFLVGLAVAWPALVVGPLLASSVSESMLLWLLLLPLVVYWALLVHLARAMWRWRGRQ